MGPELVLRDVPGKFRKRRRESQRLWRRFGTLASLYSARRKVVRIPADPGSLRPPVPLFAAGWVFAGALSLSDSWVRYKPSPADTARFLPNIGHGPHLQHEVACPETNFQSWGPPRQRLLTGTTVTEGLPWQTREPGSEKPKENCPTSEAQLGVRRTEESKS